MQPTKSLDPAAAERAKKLLAELVSGYESQSEAATAIGISQPHISDVLAGRRGIGPKVLQALTEFDPNAWAKILGRPVAVEPSAQGDARQCAIDAHLTIGTASPSEVLRAAEQAREAIGDRELSARVWFDQIDARLALATLDTEETALTRRARARTLSAGRRIAQSADDLLQPSKSRQPGDKSNLP